ncbi:Nucleotide-binding universal stress protein, UspA family [Pricia antarctica]|uniref:Nucleotide-binding universal stress protein, UspA family n=1 Tax=Pricia antarctica TaxID=641691 RepID=A0A1G7CZM4_9FLAO|nr:universal stress protein [Pricia antarctica]SDE44240.1 Nucleotide-binding universal stress protein, UspA family [Pricia antarctica]
MKKILLPTDFSDNAWNAIFTAIKLYANVDCQFYLLHAYEPQTLNMLSRKGQQRLGTIYDSLSQYSKQELSKVLTYLKENHHSPRHGFEIFSKSDTLENAVLDVVSEWDIDTVVMGTQGATGAKEIFMGSNTVKVLKKVKNCPVLVVPSGHNFQNLKILVFTTDFTRIYEKFELLPITQLAEHWKAQIQILHVAVEFVLNDTQKANRHILQQRLGDVNFSYSNVTFESNVAHSVEKFVSQNNVDLMAMIRYHHTFWEKVIEEPVVKKIAFHSNIPVLMLPERR